MTDKNFKKLNKQLLLLELPASGDLSVNTAKLGFKSPLVQSLSISPILIQESLLYLKDNFSFHSNDEPKIPIYSVRKITKIEIL